MEDAKPISVSIVENKCDYASNNVKVIDNQRKQPKKDEVIVCVRALDFDNDMSFQLIEWIELLHLLGASKIFFYIIQLHPNMSKVIDYYVSRGMVDSRPYVFPGIW